MNISIIGPEGSGKSTMAAQIAKQVAFGRPVYFIGKLKTNYKPLELSDWHKLKNGVVIIDDANAFLDSYEIQKKNNDLRDPVIMSRHDNLTNIYVFHSFDDSVKFFFRQSRYVYVSKLYKDMSYKNNKFIKGIMPEIFGRGKYLFERYKRY